MFVVGEDELGSPIGSTIICKRCGEVHGIKYGKRILDDGSKVNDDTLAFVSCPKSDALYLVGIHGREIIYPVKKKSKKE